MRIGIVIAEMRLKALDCRTKSLQGKDNYSGSEVARILNNFAKKVEDAE